MNYLKQSTAFTDKLGPFLDATDGDTEEVALTIATTDVRISKNGAAGAAQDVGAPAPSHDERSWYSINYTTTDTNTLGMFRVYIHVAGALAVWKEYTVLTAASFDALITNGLNNLGGVAQTADNDILLQEIPTNTELNARTLPSDSYFDFTSDLVTLAAVTHIGAVIPTTSVLTGHTPQTGDNFVRIGLNGAGLTNIDLPNQTFNLTGSIIGSLSGSVGSVTNDVGITQAAADKAWLTVTRELTSGNNIVLAKGLGLTGLNDISAEQVLSAGDIDGFSLEEAQKLILAGAAGKASGMETTTATIRAADDSKTRITATVDVDGNRSAVTLDVTG